MGIDPGLKTTGWGILQEENDKIVVLGWGKITPSASLSLSKKLFFIHQELGKVISAYPIQEVAIEQTFVNKNPASALILGFARGVALMTPASFGLAVYEYSPNTIKKAVVGSGHAQKHQVSLMLKRLLNIKEPLSSDSADALAVGLCHMHTNIKLLETALATAENK